jgi:hypothetical protein
LLIFVAFIVVHKKAETKDEDESSDSDSDSDSDTDEDFVSSFSLHAFLFTLNFFIDSD